MATANSLVIVQSKCSQNKNETQHSQGFDKGREKSFVCLNRRLLLFTDLDKRIIEPSQGSGEYSHFFLCKMLVLVLKSSNTDGLGWYIGPGTILKVSLGDPGNQLFHT